MRKQIRPHIKYNFLAHFGCNTGTNPDHNNGYDNCNGQQNTAPDKMRDILLRNRIVECILSKQGPAKRGKGTDNTGNQCQNQEF